jgi:uncharacterized protein
MVQEVGIKVSEVKLRDFCRRHNISRFSLFGSVLSDKFDDNSDVDVIVEFEPGMTPGLLSLAHMERELSQLFGGRKIDLRTPNELSRYFREYVLSKAKVEYASG